MLPGCRLVNAYGPTENSTMTTIHPVSESDLRGEFNPDWQAYCQRGCLYSGSSFAACVLVGIPERTLYWRRRAGPQLSQSTRIDGREISSAIPSTPTPRRKTLPDRRSLPLFGLAVTSNFSGRVDQQVKVRGFRIEMEEIENRAGTTPPAVRQAVVVAREDAPGEKNAGRLLCSASVHQMFPPEELRAFLKAGLPEYMVPAAIVMLDSLPLSPNGKVNRKGASPAPEQVPGRNWPPIMLPRALPTEKMLTEIWAKGASA